MEHKPVSHVRLSPISPEAPLTMGTSVELAKSMLAIDVLLNLYKPTKTDEQNLEAAYNVFANSPNPGVPTTHHDLELGLRYIYNSLKEHFGE